ncbi:hypothetical protein RvY_18132 [Ramazzottius varieornatus]|uniref:Spaetzle domain-containing protein n=1 Tax=Ramazzottius varieornatus TaxID=947166 RepID=A0A1D1W587_RAMVA|nr:hypothetical protein RvY_18132 [Ramazzottius varieornatus]
MKFLEFSVILLTGLLASVKCSLTADCIRGSDGLKHITTEMDSQCATGMEGNQQAHGLRQGKSLSSAASFGPFQANPQAIPKSLMEVHADMRELLDTAGGRLRMARKSDDFCTDKGCFDLPSSPCETTTDVVTPINATSATSGATVWIAQFPGLFVQTITYSKCKRTKCWYVNGGCRQLFTPYLFITHPPGPVSIFGQDYVLVESGCTCEPEMTANRSLLVNMELYLPRKP